MMASTTTTTTTTALLSSSASKKRNGRGRLAYDEIKRTLDLLNDLPRPLPADLPPSPPISRSNTPEPPSSKRRRIDEPSAAPPQNKLLNGTPPNLAHPLPSKPSSSLSWGNTNGSATSAGHHHQRSSSLSTMTVIHPTKTERRSATPSSLTGGAPSPAHKPTSPPRRKAVSAARPSPPPKRVMTVPEMQALHSELEGTSRALKRCGETRYSGRPFHGSSIEQPRNSRSKLIALLEVTEGLIQYVYQFWLADEIRGRAVQIQTWNSIMPLVGVVRRMWRDGAATDRQRAMLGLIGLIEGTVLSRTCSAAFADMAKRMESSPSGPANALSPAASGSTTASGTTPALPTHAHHHHPSHQGPHLSSHAVNNHPHAHGTHLAPPSLAHAHLSHSSGGVGGLHHHPTPPSMISPEPSPQASGTSASMHSSPSPPTPRPGGPALSTAELWEIVQKSQSGQRRLSEGQVQLSPSVLQSLFPLTWERCQAGSGATFDGVYAVGVNEGHTVDIKACIRGPPTRTPNAAAATSSSTMSLASSSSTAPSSSSSNSKTAKREEEQEEGEAEEDDPPAPTPAPLADKDDSSSDPDPTYRDHEGARWCWPFTSGDHVTHVAAFGKSLIWELARAEVGGPAPYRGADGINVIY